ncbi:MAG: hydrogenase 3 maturation endopeptidase HyCI [Nitrospirae bacterium]|nr:hydrogenase 3 maturation endopeptidase HyCI [Nitrospirota bacterium]
MTNEIRDALRPAQSGRTAILGVGNSMRMDDGVGPYIVNRLTSLPANIVCIDTGVCPENFVEDIIAFRPSKMIVIDAADFGGRCGEPRLIAEQDIPTYTLTTHSFPISITTRLIASETGCEVFFIGIQVKSTAFGEGISEEVYRGADSIIDCINRDCLQ